jgi:hypothetical protein
VACAGLQSMSNTSGKVGSIRRGLPDRIAIHSAEIVS